MKPLIQFGLRQGVLLNIVFVGLIIFSAFFAVPNLPVEQFPNFPLGDVIINTAYPGATPEEVENLVTKKIEDSLRGMENIDYIKSTSQTGLSLITVKFVDDSDYKALYNETRMRILGIQNTLPVQNGYPLNPAVSEADVDEWLPVIQVNLVSADQETPLDKRTLLLLAKELRLRLEQVDQVKKVILLGDSADQFTVAIDPKKLESHRLTLMEAINALRASGQAPPSGVLDTTAGERLIRIDSRYRSKKSILEVPVRKDGNGSIITIADLVDDQETGFEHLQGNIINRVNGLNTAGCKVLKLSSGNAIRIKKDIIAQVNKFLEEKTELKLRVIYAFDTTKKIQDGLGVLASSLSLSVVFVMILLFLFLAHRGPAMTVAGILLSLTVALIVGFSEDTLIQSIAIGSLTLFVMATCRAAVLTTSGIVFSFLGSLLVFYLTGQSINELTLLGFVLVSGIVVDDAIVVIENIQRHRESGKELIEAVVDGTSEVFWPVVSATLTTVAAFLPLLLMTGTVGDFFALVPISVAIALSISLIECLILLPLHVVDLEKILGKEKGHHQKEGDSINDFLNSGGILGTFSRLYHKMLSWTLSHPVIAISSSIALFVLALFILIMPFIGFKPILKMVFFPDNTSIVQVYVNMPAGSTLKQTDQILQQVGVNMSERGAAKIESTTSMAGMSVGLDYKPVMSSQYGLLMAELPVKSKRDFEDAASFISNIRRELEERFEKNGVDIEVSAAKDGPPVGLPVNIRVSGSNDENIMRAVNAIMQQLQNKANSGGELEGVIDVKHDRNLRTTVLSFITDRNALMNYDLREADIQNFIAGSLDGAYIADYRRSDEDIPLRLRLNRQASGDPLDLLNVPIVDLPDGRRVTFGDVGHLKVEDQPARLIRWDYQRVVTITGNISEESRIGALNISTSIKKWWLANRQQFQGVNISFGGEAESTGKSYRSLAAAFLVALCLIYAILASEFDSYLQPLLIMSNIIFSFTGVILVMSLFGIGAEMLPEGTIRPERSFITVNGFMAIVGLTGLVINDAIVLISFMNRRLKDGLPLKEALLVAGHQRMRPILMTTFTTIAGLLPMAIGIPDFSIAWSPFATAFIAGLTVSTTMTLLVLPVLFEILEKLRRPSQWKMFRQ